MSSENMNIDNDYESISKLFCDIYYSTYDNRFSDLYDFYRYDAKITYIGDEHIGFQSLLMWINSEEIYKFKHSNIYWECQPISNKVILINITGNLLVGNSIITKYFNDTFLLKKIGHRYYIVNHIFKI